MQLLLGPTPNPAGYQILKVRMGNRAWGTVGASIVASIMVQYIPSNTTVTDTWNKGQNAIGNELLMPLFVLLGGSWN